MKILDFEKPIYDLYEKIAEFKKLAEEGNIDLSKEIEKIEKRAERMKKEIYQNLSATQIVQMSRHPQRPDSLSLIRLMCTDFEELHGDRLFMDDPAIVGGPAFLDKYRVMMIGHQKGHDTKENLYRNFGMPNPEGYRKALRLMKMADKFKMPIITLVDTSGAYPGIGAEERGQAEAIARNLKEMFGFGVPIISIIIGEGGSGGALGIAVANKVHMLENTIYSVISPEGCASILFRDASKSDIAAESLKLTAKDLKELNMIDEIIPEPLEGAHTDWEVTACAIRKVITANLKTYQKNSEEENKEERYQKFRAFGQFIEE